MRRDALDQHWPSSRGWVVLLLVVVGSAIVRAQAKPQAPIPPANPSQIVTEPIGEPKLSDRDAPKRKDRWDRAAIVLPFLSALLVALVGGIFTFVYNQQQNKRQEQQRQADQDRDRIYQTEQIRLSRLQAIQSFIPYLLRTELEKKMGILGIEATGDTELAAKLAALFPSAGTAQALESIVESGEPKARDTALTALSSMAKSEDDDSAPAREALTRVFRQAGKHLFSSIPYSRSDASPEVPHAAIAIGQRHVITLTYGNPARLDRRIAFAEEIATSGPALKALRLYKAEDPIDGVQGIRFSDLAPKLGELVAAVGLQADFAQAVPLIGRVVAVGDFVTVSFDEPLNHIRGSLLVDRHGLGIGLLEKAAGINGQYIRGDRVKQFLDLH